MNNSDCKTTTNIFFNNNHDFPDCKHEEKRGHAPACQECQKKHDKEIFAKNAVNRDERALYLSKKIQENLSKNMNLLESIRELLEQKIIS